MRHDIDDYRPNSDKLKQLFISGFVATSIMIAACYFLAVLKLPALDYSATFGAMINGQETPDLLSGLWWTGLAMWIVAGTFLFPLLYDFLADKKILTNVRVVKGAIWSVVLWTFAELVLWPIAGDGFFASKTLSPVYNAWMGLFVWYLYGASLEQLSRVRIVHEIHEINKRAA